MLKVSLPFHAPALLLHNNFETQRYLEVRLAFRRSVWTIASLRVFTSIIGI
ncbi:hypothetical protein [Microcoleus sp. herbarium14]|uniref:hypothetical protein n=1 Tax=Microcoleus sp. herbarium14 TaxID=3055439 RepID=UPI002FD51419